jgi:hypothetical protein
MDRNTLKHVEIQFARPVLDPETRPALVLLPDPVRFVARLDDDERVIVAVSHDAVEDYLVLDRPPLWMDFDRMWDVVAKTAERLIRRDRFEIAPDDKTGLPKVIVDVDDLLACR